MTDRAPGAGAAHVLIVDDNEDVVEGMKIVMESAGHDVSVALTVSEAVSVALSRPVDVMLLDLTLPDGDGLDVLRRLELTDRLPTHVIALTGREAAEVRDQCIAVGCGEIMVKPVPIREILQRVSELVGVR